MVKGFKLWNISFGNKKNVSINCSIRIFAVRYNIIDTIHYFTIKIIYIIVLINKIQIVLHSPRKIKYNTTMYLNLIEELNVPYILSMPCVRRPPDVATLTPLWSSSAMKEGLNL